MSMAMTVFVGTLVLLNILGCLWLIWWTSRRQAGEEAEGTEKAHVWDEDLRELNNPLPRWWLNLFILTIIFSFAYLLLYPGIGRYAGTLGWSQAGQHDQRLAEVAKARQAHFSRFEGRSVEDLSADPEVAQVGGRLFADNCAGCHGTSARGAIGFPNLSDDDWLYGGKPEQILHSIAYGRSGNMPAFGAMLKPAELDALVALVGNWSQPPLSAQQAEAARAKFAVVCAACHGSEAQGNTLMGAPRLSDAIWLHGGKPEDLRHSITFGRSGNMPAHRELLSEMEIKLLAAFVYRISGQ